MVTMLTERRCSLMRHDGRHFINGAWQLDSVLWSAAASCKLAGGGGGPESQGLVLRPVQAWWFAAASAAPLCIGNPKAVRSQIALGHKICASCSIVIHRSTCHQRCTTFGTALRPFMLSSSALVVVIWHHCVRPCILTVYADAADES